MTFVWSATATSDCPFCTNGFNQFTLWEWGMEDTLHSWESRLFLISSGELWPLVTESLSCSSNSPALLMSHKTMHWSFPPDTKNESSRKWTCEAPCSWANKLNTSRMCLREVSNTSICPFSKAHARNLPFGETSMWCISGGFNIYPEASADVLWSSCIFSWFKAFNFEKSQWINLQSKPPLNNCHWWLGRKWTEEQMLVCLCLRVFKTFQSTTLKTLISPESSQAAKSSSFPSICIWFISSWFEHRDFTGLCMSPSVSKARISSRNDANNMLGFFFENNTQVQSCSSLTNLWRRFCDDDHTHSSPFSPPVAIWFVVDTSTQRTDDVWPPDNICAILVL